MLGRLSEKSVIVCNMGSRNQDVGLNVWDLGLL